MKPRGVMNAANVRALDGSADGDEVVVMEWCKRDGLPMVRAFGLLF